MGSPIQVNTDDVSTVIRIVDSTDGTPETGVTSATTGLALWYRKDIKPGQTPLADVALTESTLAAKTTAHTDGGLIHIGDGYYRVDLPDDAFDDETNGVIGVLIGGTATDMIVVGNYHPIVSYDPYDAADLGLSILTTIDSEVGQILADTGTDGVLIAASEDIATATALGVVDSNVDDVLVDTGTTLPASIATIDTEVGTIQTDLDNATDGLGAIKTAVDSRMAEASINTTAGAVDTVTTNTDMRGTDNASLASALSTAQTDLDTLTGADGAIIASAQTVATATSVTNQVSADVTAISGSTAAADNLEESAEAILPGLAETGTLSTTEMTTDLTVSVAGQFIGRALIFRSGTTTPALRNQATDITGTDVSGGKLTFTALTTAPSNGDSFVIV